jgi:tRNA A-37 threonylcarbamoyl transferase component Bud32
LFTFDKKQKIGEGLQGTVYDAKNLSKPNTPTVMKVGTPDPKGPSGKTAQANAQKSVDEENRFNEKMGLSAGKPVTVTKKGEAKTYLPMKKVEGATLQDELIKDRDDPNYIPSHTLLKNTKKAIDDTNNAGINHNDVFTKNVMVKKDKATLIDYGRASDRDQSRDGARDHQHFIKDLQSERVKKIIHPSRQESFKEARTSYIKAIYSPHLFSSGSPN